MSRHWQPPTQQTPPIYAPQWQGSPPQIYASNNTATYGSQLANAAPPPSHHAPNPSVHSYSSTQPNIYTHVHQWQVQPSQNQASDHHVLRPEGYSYVPPPSRHGSMSTSYWPPAHSTPPAHPLPLQQQPASTQFFSHSSHSYATRHPNQGQESEEAPDSDVPPAYQDTDVNKCNIYLLYEEPPKGPQGHGHDGPTWMIGWPILTAPQRDMWRLLYVHNDMTEVVRHTRVFDTHANGKKWVIKDLGGSTLEQRRTLEWVARETKPADVRRNLKNGEWLSVQWVEKVLTLVSESVDGTNKVLSPVQVSSEVAVAKMYIEFRMDVPFE
ncbi:hypothetical protein BC629DRAFT_1595447 [Irpex lacteus]|nr:hypothetical protein BC629DRAFT_1595447 [Irpex lacteus]